MDTKDNTGFFQCGCVALVLLFNAWIGSWSVNYLLMFFFEKTIPTIGAIAIGLFTAEISVPVAVVIAILHHFGIL